MPWGTLGTVSEDRRLPWETYLERLGSRRRSAKSPHPPQIRQGDVQENRVGFLRPGVGRMGWIEILVVRQEIAQILQLHVLRLADRYDAVAVHLRKRDIVLPAREG